MDINGDGSIGGLDRVFLSFSWLSEEGDDSYRYYADINADGDVTGIDYAFIRANWLKEAEDSDLVYPPAKAALDEVFAREVDDLLDVGLSDIDW